MSEQQELSRAAVTAEPSVKLLMPQ